MTLANHADKQDVVTFTGSAKQVNAQKQMPLP
jgi:hypothetical protein